MAPPRPAAGRTDDERYLRGAQVTDRDGIVEFITIYPGWYWPHRPHPRQGAHGHDHDADHQLYFDEDVTAAVHEREPYATDSGRDAFNDDDPIFDEALILALSKEGDGNSGTQSFDVAA